MPNLRAKPARPIALLLPLLLGACNTGPTMSQDYAQIHTMVIRPTSTPLSLASRTNPRLLDPTTTTLALARDD